MNELNDIPEAHAVAPLPLNEPQAGHRRGFWPVLQKRWGVLLLTFLLGFLVTVFYVSMQEKLHLGRAQFQIMPQLAPSILANSVGRPLERNPNFVETEFHSVSSRENLLHVVRQKGLTKRWDLGNDDNAAADKLTGMLECQRKPKSDMVIVAVYSPKMDEAAELANAVAEAYEDRRKDFEKGRAEGLVNMLQMEIDAQEKKVEEKRVAMLSVMKKYGIGYGTGSHSIQPTTAEAQNNSSVEFNATKTRLTEAGNDLVKLRAQTAIIAATKDPVEAAEIAAGTYADTAELKASLQAYHELQRRSSPNPSELEAAQRILTIAFASLKLVQEAKIKATETELTQLGKSVNDLVLESISAKARESEYLMANREYDLHFALLSSMQEAIGRLKVDLELPLIPTRRHENAYPSPKVARPQGELLLAIGASIALMLGLALAFILEYCKPD